MANTADEQRRRVHQIAEAIAPTWERRRAYIEGVTAPVRRWLIRELAPREGDRVLELAAGAGDTGFEAAAIVGNDGRLVSTDFSAAMLDVARRRGAELGVRNVDYLEIDAERIGLDSSSVDGVLCRFGYMLMADPPAALAETERVLRPGGRVALAVWGRSEDNPFFELIGTALVEAGLMAPPGQDGPSPFSMATGQLTGDLLRGAGFADISDGGGRGDVRLRRRSRLPRHRRRHVRSHGTRTPERTRQDARRSRRAPRSGARAVRDRRGARAARRGRVCGRCQSVVSGACLQSTIDPASALCAFRPKGWGKPWGPSHCPASLIGAGSFSHSTEGRPP